MAPQGSRGLCLAACVALATLRAAPALAQAPPQRALDLDGAGNLHFLATRTDWIANTTVVQGNSTGTYAVDSSSLRVAQTTDDPQGGHSQTVTHDYSRMNTTLAEGFFGERVCFTQEIAPFQGESPSRMFEGAVWDIFWNRWYVNATFLQLTAGGDEVWRFRQYGKGTHQQKDGQGNVYNLTQSQELNYTYTVAAASGADSGSDGAMLVSFLVTKQVYQTWEPVTPGAPKPTNTHFTLSTNIGYSDVVRPAPAGSFSPGEISAPCALLIPHNMSSERDAWRREAVGVVLRGGGTVGNSLRADVNAHELPAMAPIALGARLPLAPLFGRPAVAVAAKQEASGSADSAIPAAFDVREQWPHCAALTGAIRNQGQCGSCWAFSAAEVLGDRACIASLGLEKVQRSPAWLAQCDADNAGCNGGYLDNAWMYLQAQGLPAETCDPYSAVCPDETQMSCVNASGTGPQPQPLPAVCPAACADGSKPRLLRAKNVGAVGLPGDVEAIQREMMAHGPVQAGFFVFSDFSSYTGGVYAHVAGSMILGGHAVKLLGWGETDDGTPYWTVANSWSVAWGESGTFRIIRGVDESGIESTVAAGEASLLEIHTELDRRSPRRAAVAASA